MAVIKLTNPVYHFLKCWKTAIGD